AWRRRPRIDLSGPYDAEREAELLEMFGSEQRLELLRTTAAEYTKLPSLENYLRLRTSFSEGELSVAVFNELENLLALQSEQPTNPISTSSRCDSWSVWLLEKSFPKAARGISKGVVKRSVMHWLTISSSQCWRRRKKARSLFHHH